jgi:hypothetical protein
MHSAVGISAVYGGEDVNPAVQGLVMPWIIAPDFFVEFAVALWLTIKGISTAAAPV